MLRFERQRFQNQQVLGALRKIDATVHEDSPSSSTGANILDLLSKRKGN